MLGSRRAMNCARGWVCQKCSPDVRQADTNLNVWLWAPPSRWKCLPCARSLGEGELQTLLSADLQTEQKPPVDKLSLHMCCIASPVCSWLSCTGGQGSFCWGQGENRAFFPGELRSDVGKGIGLKPAELASPRLLLNIYLTSSSFRECRSMCSTINMCKCAEFWL